MKTIQLLTVIGSFAIVQSASADWWRALTGAHDLEVITNGDVMTRAENLRHPTPENPIYYVALPEGLHSFGSPIAGDKAPKEADVIATVTRVLEKQGYKPSTKDHPASMVIAYAWGTLYQKASVATYDGTVIYHTGTPSPAKAYFLGLDKFGQSASNAKFREYEISPNLFFSYENRSHFYEYLEDDHFAVALAAYEMPDPKNRRAHLLWRTRIASPSRGFSMDDSIIKMIAIAGPSIGYHTKEPIAIRASDYYKPDVQIGTPIAN